MTIYDYTDEGNHVHPGGFTGYRVLVMVDGETNQHYYPGTPDGLQQAIRMDEILSLEQATAKAKRDKVNARLAKPCQRASDKFAPPRQTGIRGLSISIEANKRCNPAVWYPAIVIAASNLEGKRFSTTRAISYRTRTLPQAWDQVCRMLADLKELKRVPAHWQQARPLPSQFEKLRLYYNKHHRHGIRKDVLLPVSRGWDVDEWLESLNDQQKRAV